MNHILLEAATPTASMGLSTILMVVIMLAVMYFFVVRPQKKQEKETNNMLNNLAVGDEVTTIGGVIGTVVDVKENNVVVETSADQVRIEFEKWAISSNETAVAAAREEAKKKQEAKAKAKAEKLKPKDRIKLGDVDVTTWYNKEKGVEYVTYKVFDFETSNGSGSSDAPAKSTKSTKSAKKSSGLEDAVEDGDVEEDNLPF